MVPMGPDHWGPDSEEWVIHLNYPVDDLAAQSDEKVEADVGDASDSSTCRCTDPQDHALVGRRGHGVDVPGRPRLPGRRRRTPPPADRRPRPDERDPRRAQPVLEARRRARRARGEALLDTYEPERRPRTSATPSARSRTPSTSSRSWPPPASRTRMRRSRTGRTCAGCGAAAPRTPSTARGAGGDPRRSRWSSTSSTSSSATRTSRPRSSTTAPRAAEPVDDIRVYEPSTRPGAPLPHAWIDDDDGQSPSDQGSRRAPAASC